MALPFIVCEYIICTLGFLVGKLQPRWATTGALFLLDPLFRNLDGSRQTCDAAATVTLDEYRALAADARAATLRLTKLLR
jgi:hypothetical protein